MSDNFISNKNFLDFELILKKIYSERKFILKFSTITFFIGLMFALITPNQYTTSSTFVPQISDNKSSNSLSALASLTGINLSQIDNSPYREISPLLYPKIMESVPFRIELLNSKIIHQGEDVSIRNYIISSKPGLLSKIKKYTIGLPSLLFNKLSSQKNVLDNSSNLNYIYSITNEDEKLFTVLEKLVSLTLFEKDGFITLSTTHSDKYISAQITKNAELILQNKIIEIKSKSSKEFLIYVTDQYDLKRNELNKLQDDIAIFRDRNVNINSLLFKNKLDRMLSDYEILKIVVQQLASQVEEAKLSVNKDTPIFTIIQPVHTPYSKTKPSRSTIVFLWVLFGIFASSAFILFNKKISNFLDFIRG